MSRQNKVNPGMYTQRGRLTQDDAARELRKQRDVGSQHTWQPVKKDQLPRFESKNDQSDEGTETPGDTSGEQLPSADNVQPTKRAMKKAKSSPSGKVKSAQPKAAKSGAARKTAAKSKTKATTSGKAAKTAVKAKATKPVKRQAVLARNTGGGGPTPRKTTTRRKS